MFGWVSRVAEHPNEQINSIHSRLVRVLSGSCSPGYKLQATSYRLQATSCLLGLNLEPLGLLSLPPPELLRVWSRRLSCLKNK